MKTKRSLEKLFFIGICVLMLSRAGFAADKIPVFVSIVPQKYFVQQIGKELVNVQVMVQPGASPATYEPKARQMADLSKTKIYFAIGVPFEKSWLKKIATANPKMGVVQTDQGIAKIPMATHHHAEQGQGQQMEKGEAHQERQAHHPEDDGRDPHIWLSPPLVKIQARTITTALQDIDPGNGAVYEANYRQFAADIDALDDRLRQLFAGNRGLRFMVFHPSWGYFANAYGLKQIPIEIEGKAPKPAQLKALIEHARSEGIQVVFVQPQFSTKSADLVAKEIGGRVAFADPLAADWMANLYNVADQFKAALR